jgi:two-component system, chemotaxis family, CheB/CheR fusion protein
VKIKNVGAAVIGKTFPIVGVGASAGGLAAFEAFFGGVSKDTLPEMAFVLVQHLAPDHPSSLTELVQRYTKMRVLEATNGAKIQINCCYVIPPNVDLSVSKASLQLSEPAQARGHRTPIDFLFRSLSVDQAERSIAIVLSGTGSDGSIGITAIKDKGGMVMAQSPSQSEFDGMPRSAIATGLVDYELPPGEMMARLISYVTSASVKLSEPNPATLERTSDSLQKIFAILKSDTGHDFARYKPNTIVRRIERRMAFHRVTGFEEYLSKMQKLPDEVGILFKELLIGVTSFFRDPDAYAKLESLAIAELIGKDSQDLTLRVWVAGCSTGEEAYSIAILLQERMEQLKKNVRLMIFATDIDAKAIGTARGGVYPKGIESDISAERLSKFFTLETDGNSYRIHKTVRDSLIFSEHDLIRDPPFSKIDLISCRNLLIYFEADLQSRVIALFHYSLVPKGTLFLGSSESVGELSDLYSALDRKAKLYQRKDDIQGDKRASLARFLPKTPPLDLVSGAANSLGKALVKPSLRELTEQSLLNLVAPVAVLVDAQGDIFYLRGRSGLFLEPSAGDASVNNVLKMAREGLRGVLATALYQVVLTKQAVHSTGFGVISGDGVKRGRFSLCAVAGSSGTSETTSLYLVVLEEVLDADLSMHPGNAVLPPANRAQPLSANDGIEMNRQIQVLSEQLRAKEDVLQASNQELENSNEELKSSNEEMQSVNEELQSTNEELETSKEEMQSVNEELSTVNTELQLKVNDSYRANNDMNNLLAGTGIGTVFLDLQLRILRFTPAATKIIPLIDSDLGRPIAHLTLNLIGYDTLVSDIKAVLESLVAKEAIVKTDDGRFYTLRVLPYRTLDNVVEGAVITFIEITEMVRIRLALRKANDLLRLAVVVRDSFDAITVQDLDGQTIAWNPGAVRMYGWTEQEALNLNVVQRVPKALRSAASTSTPLNEEQTLEPVRTQRLAKDGRLISVFLTSTALLDDHGVTYAIATTEREDKLPSL